MSISFKDTNHIAHKIIQYHQLSEQTLTKYKTGTNDVFSYGNDFVVKTYEPGNMEEQVTEVSVMKHLNNQLQLHIPNVVFEGKMKDIPYLIMTQVQGQLLEDHWEEFSKENKLQLMQEIGASIAATHQVTVHGLPEIYLDWNTFINQQIQQCVEHHEKLGIKASLVQEIPAYIQKHRELLPNEFRPVLLTGEYTPFNLLIQWKEETWKLTGMIDFADCMIGFHEYDLLGPAVFMACGDRELTRALFLSYGYTKESLNTPLKKRLTLLMLLHRYSNLKAQIQLERWEEKVNSLTELEDLLWSF
jgi:hygromycin-B 7''-O-kinase